MYQNKSILEEIVGISLLQKANKFTIKLSQTIYIIHSSERKRKRLQDSKKQIEYYANFFFLQA